MSSRTASRLAWSVGTLSLALIAATLVLIFLGWSTPLPSGWTTWQERALSVAEFIGAPIVGGLIASRRPANIYGWLWLGLVGMAQALLQFGQAYAAYALVVDPGSACPPDARHGPGTGVDCLRGHRSLPLAAVPRW